MSEPMTEEALAEIDSLANHVLLKSMSLGPLASLVCGNIPRLIAEIRRLRNREICVPTKEVALEAQLSSLDGKLLVAIVERDNFRKMLDDSHALSELQIRIIAGLREQLHLKPEEPIPMCKDPMEDLNPR